MEDQSSDERDAAEAIESEILVALCDGRVNDARQLVGLNPQVVARNIYIASAFGDPASVERQLQGGESANAFLLVTDDGEQRIPVLSFASIAGNAKVARVLLEHGADPNDGESVYHAAELNQRDCLQVLKEFGADLNGTGGQQGNTPLYFIAGHRESSPLSASSELGMRWLLDNGADPNALSHLTPTAEGRESFSETPLHRVAASGLGYTVARLLVTHGATIDAERGDGKTAYVLALRAGNVEVAHYLEEVGADTSRASLTDRFVGACARADRESAFAILLEQSEIMKMLSEDDKQALAIAVEEGNEESILLMIELGWNLSVEGPWAGTPLHHAAWNGRLEIARLMIESGSPVNVRDRAYGATPIEWATNGSENARPGHDEEYGAIIELLLKAGASPCG